MNQSQNNKLIPRAYQERALEELQKHNYNGLIAAGLGTGKTFMACEAARQSNAQRVLIVGPVRTRAGWERHVDVVNDTTLKVLNSKKQGKLNRAAVEAGEPGFYFIGWELMRSWYSELRFDGRAKHKVRKSITQPFNGVEFDLVIADEWHRAANHNSLNRDVITHVRAKRRLALSATPAGNKPANIWSALDFLWPKKWGGYWAFAAKYFREEYNPFSSFGKTYTDEKKPGMVRRGTPCYIEISSKEANPEMPDVVVERVSVDLSREQRRIYDEWEQTALAWLDDNPVALDMPAQIDLRLRQATLGAVTINDEGLVDYAVDCKSSKLDAMLDILSDLPDGEPVVVWVHSQKFIKAVLHRLKKAGYTAAEISGKSKADFRDMINGKVQVLVAQHEAMSEGVDGLQLVCHVEIWLSQSNSLIINEQATGRLHRQGQTQPVIRYLIQAEGTIDDTVVGRLTARFDSLKASGLI